MNQNLTNVNDALARYQYMLGRRDAARQTVKKLKVTLKEQNIKFALAETALTILHTAADERQKNVIGLFEKTVTAALKQTFDEKYKFTVEFKRRGSSFSAEFMLENGKYKRPKPLKYCQGRGVKDVISVILQQIFTALLKCEKTVFIDEGLTGVQKSKLPVVTEFIKKVCKDFKIQVVLITHLDEIYNNADRRIRIC